MVGAIEAAHDEAYMTDLGRARSFVNELVRRQICVPRNHAHHDLLTILLAEAFKVVRRDEMEAVYAR